jgi:type IX secretion system PorP/SprF family membrane protein
LLLHCIIHVNGQTQVENFPLQFSQFTNSYPLTNPASIGAINNKEATLGYQQPIKGFTGVSTYFLHLGIVPYKLKHNAKSKNVIGLRFYNDKEGAYIKRTRFYAVYAFHTKITSKINFSGGIDFGGMNYAVKSTPSTEGRSTINFDSNAGIWLYNNDFHVGISLNQLLKSDFQPFNEITKLPFHINFSASKNLINSPDIILTPHIIVTYPYYSQLTIRGYLYCLLFEKLIAGMGSKYRENIVFSLGINHIELYESFIDFTVSYTKQTSKISYGINTIETSINYTF